jgi:hypothetical protein
MASGIAFKPSKQGASRVTKLVFIVGLPKPVTQSPMAWSIGFDADFEARRMGTC